jgi:hypothetical protein
MRASEMPVRKQRQGVALLIEFALLLAKGAQRVLALALLMVGPMQKPSVNSAALPDPRRSSHVDNAFEGRADACFHRLSASLLALA